MTRRIVAIMLAAFLLPFVAAPAAAQDYRGALGVYGGGIWFSDLNENGDVLADALNGNGDLDLFGFSDLSLETNWLAGAQGEYWFGNGRFGLRANAGYTETDFDLDGDGVIVVSDGAVINAAEPRPDIITFDDFGDVNTWLLDGNLMVRLLTPERDRMLAPFLSLGAGVVHYNPAGEAPVIIPTANARMGDVTFVDGDFVIGDGDNDETQFAGVIGLGTDIAPGRFFGIPLMLRLELADHIAFESPVEPIVAFEEFDDEFVDVDDDYDAVHNVRLTLGAHATFGRLFPEEEVAVAPAPPPAPEPEEEMIRVCIVDPMIEDGVGYVDAVFMPQTGDTLVVVNGQRVRLGEATRGAVVARDLDWYRTGEPLTMRLAGETAEFVAFGGGRIIEPDELALLGTVDGLPVYANAEEAGDIADDLEDLRETRRDDDLEDLLEERAELREEFNELEILYVPLEATGCVFQPLERIEEVRKMRR